MKHNMCLLFSLALAFAGFVPSGTEVSVVEGTLQNSIAIAWKVNDPLSLDTRSAELRISFPSGKLAYQLINMAYDPSSRLFLWRYTDIEPGSKLADVQKLQEAYNLQLTRDKIVGFTCSWSTVSIVESGDRFASMEEGQSNIIRSIKSNPQATRNAWHQLLHQIDLRPLLGNDFVLLRGSASPFPMPTLRDVKRKDGQWELLFDGPNKDSAKITLSDDYRILGVKHFPAK